jgi:hypothetical protein
MRQYSGTCQIFGIRSVDHQVDWEASGQKSSRVKLHLLGYLVQRVIERRRKKNEICVAVGGHFLFIDGRWGVAQEGNTSVSRQRSRNEEAIEDVLFQTYFRFLLLDKIPPLHRTM